MRSGSKIKCLVIESPALINLETFKSELRDWRGMDNDCDWVLAGSVRDR